MPELPEVETMKNNLWDYIANKKIKNILANRPNLRFSLPSNLKSLHNDQFIKAHRHGKYILLETENDMMLLVHLGMTGRFVIPGKEDYDPKHEHIIFTFEDESKISYFDPRRFGYIDLFHKKDKYKNRFIQKLGSDALNIKDDFDRFFIKVQKRKTPIKNALLDQSLLAGVGNIYASEALWRTKINPLTPCNKINRYNLYQMCGHIEDILQEAIKAGGSTLKDYRNIEGDKGDFQNHFDVYSKDSKLCSRADGGVIEKSVMAGRATYHCPVCQKIL